MIPADVFTLALILLMVLAAGWDALKLRIPNLLVVAVLAVFVAKAAIHWSHMPILWHLASGAIVLAAGMLMFARGWWGGGDAKLAFAGALFVPLSELSTWLLWTVLSGGALALLLLVGRRLIPATAKVPPILARRGPIPYGIAIAIGTVATVLSLQPEPPPAIRMAPGASPFDIPTG